MSVSSMVKNKPNRPLNQSFQQGCARLRYITFDNIALAESDRHDQGGETVEAKPMAPMGSDSLGPLRTDTPRPPSLETEEFL